MAKQKFDVDQLQKEANEREFKRTQDRQRDSKNHHQRFADVNVQASYEESLRLCVDEEGNVDADKVEHLESVLSAGPIRYDR